MTRTCWVAAVAVAVSFYAWIEFENYQLLSAARQHYLEPITGNKERLRTLIDGCEKALLKYEGKYASEGQWSETPNLVRGKNLTPHIGLEWARKYAFRIVFYKNEPSSTTGATCSFDPETQRFSSENL
jgi:hypothetical protein